MKEQRKKLRRCPSCFGKVKYKVWDGDRITPRIECMTPKCGMCMRGKDYDSLVERWNTRIPIMEAMHLILRKSRKLRNIRDGNSYVSDKEVIQILQRINNF